MGRDKGSLQYHAVPQARHAWKLLTEICGSAFVSTRPQWANAAPYSELPLIIDRDVDAGPAAGLLAAWHRVPECAWLVLAVDMPLVDAGVLAELVQARNPETLATAFHRPDGGIEPLCAIYEPSARPVLSDRVARGDASPRRFLEVSAVTLVAPREPEKLRSVDDPDSHRTLAAALAGGRSSTR